jgi:hypothetical protein
MEELQQRLNLKRLLRSKLEIVYLHKAVHRTTNMSSEDLLSLLKIGITKFMLKSPILNFNKGLCNIWKSPFYD